MTPKECTEYAYALFEDFGLIGWTFHINDNKRRLGVCKFRTKRIEVSERILVNRAELDDTIRHEIAHALAGSKAKHGPDWKKWAAYCGAKPQHCADADADIPQTAKGARLKAVCVCGDTHYLYRRPKRLHGWYCKKVPGKPPITWEPTKG